MPHEALIRWLVGVGLVVGIWCLGWLFRRFALGRLAQLVRRTPTDLDEMLLDAIRPHIPLWFLLLGIMVGARYVEPDATRLAVVDKASLAILIASLTLGISSFLTRLVSRRAAHWPETLPSTTLVQNAVRIVVVGLGALIVLSNLGIAITPLLTALGVGSLAVALALQPTLSNLFAGFYIALARQIRVGDYVELETGQQGYVVDIGWRSTQIRELPNNLVVVPNARIAEIIVKNYALPVTEQSALVQVGVSYSSDLDQVERVTVDVAREIQRTVQGALPTFEPFIRYHTFGDSSINFSVILRVKEFTDRYLVTHEFVKRLHRRFEAEGIEIPFPQRVVHVADVGMRGDPGVLDEGKREIALVRPGTKPPSGDDSAGR
jgi:small-conductance mechanosensitive channel